MRKFRFNPLLLIGILGVLTGGSLFAVHLYRAFGGDREIWWTHQNQPLSLEEGRQAFELQYKGRSLKQLLGDGSLMVREPDGSIRPARAADWKVRLNNWYRVQAAILGMSLLPCALFSISLTLFFVAMFLVPGQIPEEVVSAAGNDDHEGK